MKKLKNHEIRPNPDFVQALLAQFHILGRCKASLESNIEGFLMEDREINA